MAHWTDAHIRFEEGKWIAFDEAHLEHGRYNTKDEARDALVIYEAVYLSNRGRAFQCDVKLKMVDSMLETGKMQWMRYEIEWLKDDLNAKIKMWEETYHV